MDTPSTTVAVGSFLQGGPLNHLNLGVLEGVNQSTHSHGKLIYLRVQEGRSI